MRTSGLTTLIACVAILLSLGTSFGGDVKIVTQTTAVGFVSDPPAAKYIKGERTRLEWRNQFGTRAGPNGEITYTPGPQRITLSQCDAHRTLELDPEAHEFKVFELEERGHWVGEKRYVSETHPSGKTVTITTETIDTGERRLMFGRQARHLITKDKRVPEPGACSGASETTQDTWYLDFELPESCPKSYPSGKRGFQVLSSSGCQDKYVFQVSGVEPNGFPVESKTTTTSEFRGPIGTIAKPTNTFVYISRVIELSEAPLDPELFEVPADYKQVWRLKSDPPLTLQSVLSGAWDWLFGAIPSH